MFAELIIHHWQVLTKNVHTRSIINYFWHSMFSFNNTNENVLERLLVNADPTYITVDMMGILKQAGAVIDGRNTQVSKEHALWLLANAYICYLYGFTYSITFIKLGEDKGYWREPNGVCYVALESFEKPAIKKFIEVVSDVYKQTNNICPFMLPLLYGRYLEDGCVDNCPDSPPLDYQYQLIAYKVMSNIGLKIPFKWLYLPEAYNCEYTASFIPVSNYVADYLYKDYKDIIPLMKVKLNYNSSNKVDEVVNVMKPSWLSDYIIRENNGEMLA